MQFLATNRAIFGRSHDGGPSGLCRVGLSKKSGVFIRFFRFFIFIFLFFPHLFIFKKVVHLTAIYLYVYLPNICGWVPGIPGYFIFIFGGPNSRVWQVGRYFPRSRRIPGIFDGMGWAQMPWEARGGWFPQSLHLGGYLIKLGSRCVTQKPADHSHRLPIHIGNTRQAQLTGPRSPTGHYNCS